MSLLETTTTGGRAEHKEPERAAIAMPLTPSSSSSSSSTSSTSSSSSSCSSSSSFSWHDSNADQTEVVTAAGATRPPQLRILLLAASPPSHNEAFVAQFKDVLLTALNDYLFDIDYHASPATPSPVVLYFNLRCQLKDVQYELLRAKPHVVHVYAHMDDKTNSGVLLMDESQERGTALASKLLSDIVEVHNWDEAIKSVLLTGCKSEEMAHKLCNMARAPPDNVPTPLVGHVLYTTAKVHYKVCQVWSAAWYASVFQGHSVGRAATIAKGQVKLDSETSAEPPGVIQQKGDEELVLLPLGAGADGVAGHRPQRHRPDYFNVPRRDLAHIKRPRVWRRLRQALQELGRRRFVVLTGMGGVGKSQLALHYVVNPPLGSDRYRFVAWFAAEDPTQLPTQYRDFAEQFMPAGTDLTGKSDKAVVAVVTRWLARKEHWLLVYDNATTFKAIVDYLPQQADDSITQHVLVTSRHLGWPIDTCNAVDIGVMLPAECLTLLTKFAGVHKEDHTQDADLIELLTLLGRLPLAMSQAAAYIAKQAVRVRAYVEAYERLLTHEEKDGASLPDGDPHTIVARTWDITLAALHTEMPDRPLGRIMLTVCTYLAPDAIPRALLETWCQLAYPDLPQDVDVCSMVLGLLRDYSLVHYTDEAKQFLAVHRVLSAVVRRQHEAVDSRWPRDVWYPLSGPQWTEMVARALNIEYSREWQLELQRDGYRKRLRVHLQHTANRHEMLNTRECEPSCLRTFARLWYNTGKLQLHLGSVLQAKRVLQLALAMERELYGDEHVEVAITLHALADVHGTMGDYVEQRQLLEQSLAIKRRHYGGDQHVEVAAALHALAGVHDTMGDYVEQRRMLDRAISITRCHYGSDEHIKVAATLYELAGVHGSMGEYAEQRQLLEQVLAIERRHFGGDEHVSVAATLHELAGVHGTMGEYAEQRRLLEQALAIKRRHYGSDEHIKVAATLYELAGVHGTTGDHVEQRRLLEQVLAIERRHYGDEHVEVAAALHSLAGAHGKMGGHVEQRRLLEQVLAIYRRHYGSDEHVEVAVTLRELAGVHGTMDDHVEQRRLLEQVLAIYRRHYGGDENINVAATLHALAGVHGTMGEYAEQRRLREQALAIARRHYGDAE
jgi:tetratricopeptide (TPR) repeat protein